MMRQTFRAWAALVLLVSAPAYADREVVTADSVAAMAAQGNPFAIQSNPLFPFAPFFGLLLPNGALSHDGPLGGGGPLGQIGPLSPVIFSPLMIFQIIGNFEGFSKLLTLNGGPMSELGPLGPHGPLSMYDQLSGPLFFPFTGFTSQLQAGGVLAPLGPLGPMSPLGPFGPLGPLGDHGGFGMDPRSGSYVDSRGQVRRTLTATFGDRREFELVENYEESFALRMRDNDTSFTVSGTSAARQPKRFVFSSRTDQILTIVLVPGASKQVWSLRLIDARGVVAQSGSSVYVNWIQLPVRRGESFAVDLASNRAGTYRLYVVGSGPDFTRFEVSGRHVLRRP